MNLNKLSIKELFFLHLTDDMNRKPNQSYRDASSIYFDELKARIGDDSDSIDLSVFLFLPGFKRVSSFSER